MVNVTLDSDEWYPVYEFVTAPFDRTIIPMTHSEFVRMVMLQARWARMQADLAYRAGYFTLPAEGSW